MKRVVKVLVILLFLLYSFWLGNGYLSGKEAPQKKVQQERCIKLESISFNHDLKCSDCDAINIRKNCRYGVNVPEWENNKSYPAAYIMNKYVTIKAVFSADSGIKTARIRALRRSGEFGDLGEELVRFKENGTSCPVYFKIPGKTPGEIKAFDQEWEWCCRDINEVGSIEKSIGKSENRIYILLKKPHALPWGEKGEQEPWADALEYACTWAEGAIDTPSAADKITKYLYSNIGAYYQKWWRYTRDQNTNFNLSSFLKSLSTKFGVEEVNCFDMAKALVTFVNVLGCDLLYKESNQFGNSLNCIKPIGLAQDSCIAFKKHSFGSTKNNIIFDPTIIVVPDEWMVNIPWDAYIKKVIKNGSAKCPSSSGFGIGDDKNKKNEIDFKELNILKKSHCFSINTNKLIPAINISTDFFKDFDPSLEFECVRYSIERVENEYHSVIRKVWKDKNKDQLEIKMTVLPSIEKAERIFSLKRFYNTRNCYSFKLYMIDDDLPCCVYTTPEGKACKFDGKDVRFEIKVTGELTNIIVEITKELHIHLKKKAKVNSAKPKKIPKIIFSKEKMTVEIGESVDLPLEEPRENNNLTYFWRVSGGEIKKKSNKLQYCGKQVGEYWVKIIVMNDIGLISCTKPLIIKVIDKKLIGGKK